MDLETQVYDDGAETPVEEIISEEIEEDVPEADDFAALSTQKYVEAEPEGAAPVPFRERQWASDVHSRESKPAMHGSTLVVHGLRRMETSKEPP